MILIARGLAFAPMSHRSRTLPCVMPSNTSKVDLLDVAFSQGVISTMILVADLRERFGKQMRPASLHHLLHGASNPYRASARPKASSLRWYAAVSGSPPPGRTRDEASQDMSINRSSDDRYSASNIAPTNSADGCHHPSTRIRRSDGSWSDFLAGDIHYAQNCWGEM